MAKLAGKGLAGVYTVALGGGSGALGRDFFDLNYTVTSSGAITDFDIAVDGAPTVTLKVFRENGASLDFISESDSFLCVNGDNNLVLSSTIDVLVGDICAIHVEPDGAITNKVSSSDDVAGATDWSGDDSDYSGNISASVLDNPLAVAMAISVNGTPDTPPSDEITVSDIAKALVMDLSTGDVSFALSGAYSGTPTAIQVQIHYADDDTIVSAWSDYDLSPSSGVWSGSEITLPETTRGYYAAVRYSNDTAINDTSNTTVCAYKITVFGESFARDMATDGTDVTPATNVFYMDKDSGVLTVPAAGSGNTMLANIISSEISDGYGVIVCNSGHGGEALMEINRPGNAYYPTPTVDYTNAISAYYQGGEAHAVVLLLGINDSYYAIATTESYYAAWGDFFDEFRADTRLDLPIIASYAGRNTTAPDSEKYGNYVLTQISALNAQSNIYIVGYHDLPLQDTTHLSADQYGYGVLGVRCANAILDNVFGITKIWKSPVISQVKIISDTETEFTVLQGDGSEIATTTGITDVKLSDDSGDTYSVSISSVEKSSANTFIATHSSANVTDYRYDFGSNYSVTGVVLDDNGLPLFPSSGLVIAVTSTLNLIDTGAPDGTYSADIYNNDTKTLIETRDITFSGGDASETIPLDIGAEVLVLIEGSNPPVTGIAYIGVTE